MTTRKIKTGRKKPLEAGEGTVTKGIDNAFWHPKSAEELRREQNARPFDFSKAGENWPEDADFEEFKAAINRVRKFPREW